MFCNKCGKFIEYNSTICNECAQEYYKNSAYNNNTQNNISNNGFVYNETEKVQTVNAEPIYNQQYVQPVQNSRMLGFGKALISAIFPMVAFIIVYISIFMYGIAIVDSAELGGTLEAALMMLFVALAMDIIAMVFSSQSIHLVTRTVKNGGARPIATQICGIVGRVSSIVIMVLISIFFMVYIIPLL